QDYWLKQTGAGAALDAGKLLGLIVGIVIVAQTLYSSTKDHINEFATLRALGAGAGYIVKVILIQAILSGLIGYTLGMSLAL
ncbi:FtsX-like permease family protein, partial [Geobacillus thermoleovorans]